MNSHISSAKTTQVRSPNSAMDEMITRRISITNDQTPFTREDHAIWLKALTKDSNWILSWDYYVKRTVSDSQTDVVTKLGQLR